MLMIERLQRTMDMEIDIGRLVMACALMLVTIAKADEINVGFSRVDITPPMGTFMPMQLTTEVARAGRIIRMAGHADYHLIY